MIEIDMCFRECERMNTSIISIKMHMVNKRIIMSIRIS